MKKTWNRMFYIHNTMFVFVALLIFLSGCIWRDSFSSDEPIEISGIPIDNDTNNLIAGGNLIRMGDVLYYNYNQTDAYALMELSAGGATVVDRMHNKGLDPASGPAVMRKHQDCFVYTLSDVPMAEHIPFEDIFFQESDHAYIYLRYEEAELPAAIDRAATLVVYENGTETTLAENVILWKFYVANDIVYYLKNLGHCYEIRRHDLATHSDEAITNCTIREVPYEFFAVGQRVVFSLQNGVYVTNVFEQSDLQPIKKGTASLNVYNGLVYLAAEDGVFSYDPTTEKMKSLCSRPAKECYILDDTWVYFVSDNASLWRVSQDSQTEEHVYG